MGIKSFFAAAALGIASVFAPAAAGPLTTYELELTIDSVQLFSPCDVRPASFGCLGVGDTFRGRFSVDSAILATDGFNNTAAVYDFFLPFGKLVYATGPENTALAGFRNPALGAAAPGFRILGGQVVDLVGGVYGFADIPFIDMSGNPGVPANRFSAFDGSTAALGSLRITTPVPEPETYAMWLIGLGVLWAVRRKRQ